VSRWWFEQSTSRIQVRRVTTWTNFLQIIFKITVPRNRHFLHYKGKSADVAWGSNQNYYYYYLLFYR
jgi:hypothetical protein